MYILTQAKRGILNSKKVSGVYIREEPKDCTYIVAIADNISKPVILGEYQDVETDRKFLKKFADFLGMNSCMRKTSI